jgi:hypothetical protein
MNNGVPMVEKIEHRKLELFAIKNDWEHSEYFAERDILEQNFRIWIRMFAAYSAIILLYSIFETQLYAFAVHIGKARDLKRRVEDTKGKGIEQSAKYLSREALISVTDPPWTRLKDLQKLRNIIVHRGGRSGESQDHRSDVDKLVERYPQALTLLESGAFRDQTIGVSMDLCTDFARDTEEFFERVFKAAGLPNRHLQLES